MMRAVTNQSPDGESFPVDLRTEVRVQIFAAPLSLSGITSLTACDIYRCVLAGDPYERAAVIAAVLHPRHLPRLLLPRQPDPRDRRDVVR